MQICKTYLLVFLLLKLWLPKMILFQIKNPFGRDTILTHDTWDEILFKHPEMIGHLDEV